MRASSSNRVHITRGNTGESQWEMVSCLLPARFSPFVREWVGYTERAPRPTKRPEIPGPSAILIFEFGPPVRIREPGPGERWTRIPGGFAAGLDDAVTITEHAGYQAGLQLSLTPRGARALFGLPMSELARRAVPARDVLPRHHRDLAGRLHDLDWVGRFRLLEQLLDERLAAAEPDLTAVDWAYRRIVLGGAVDMRLLAREMGCSPKHMIHLFHEHVGLAPKLLARLARFHRLMRHVRDGGREGWADLALEFGYYDQSHLVRDVKQFTGESPTRVLRTMFAS